MTRPTKAGKDSKTMNTLIRVVASSHDKKNCVIEPIKDYTRIMGTAANGYCVADPVSYTDTENRVFSASLADIGHTNLTKALGHIGNSYRIAAENIVFV